MARDEGDAHVSEASMPAAAQGADIEPPALLAFEQQLKEARSASIPEKKSVPAKLCVGCGVDVSLDAFRQRSGDGYICTDCQDAEVDRADRRRRRARAVIAILVVICVAGAIPVAVIYTISHVPVMTRPQ